MTDPDRLGVLEEKLTVLLDRYEALRQENTTLKRELTKARKELNQLKASRQDKSRELQTGLKSVLQHLDELEAVLG
ncbi:MAG: hypothetical protein D6800_11950 [Candidatus Zixiibacteriota bacterium]|nr:MAG: hypothetical protein D6800_11950 [candidate division Zixibacteria bacterium]